MKQVALVTGGSRGIGYGIVKHLAMQGFDLAINGVRTEEVVEDVIESIQASESLSTPSPKTLITKARRGWSLLFSPEP